MAQKKIKFTKDEMLLAKARLEKGLPDDLRVITLKEGE